MSWSRYRASGEKLAKLKCGRASESDEASEFTVAGDPTDGEGEGESSWVYGTGEVVSHSDESSLDDELGDGEYIMLDVGDDTAIMGLLAM